MSMQERLKEACRKRRKELRKEGFSEVYIDMIIERFEEGYKEGFIKGFIQEYEKCIEQERMRSFRVLQDHGIPFEDTCRLLKLTEEEIERCRDSLKGEVQTDWSDFCNPF